ncbi:MAG: Lacal_2735 family protein [Bacteroidota bacterium]|nr:Lacal_2735 family protein [Bacteroidota bacterium]|tara:strand:- start:474 stop:656 length:183 start_codon:yes stop_codon:yes gene_type:complete
MFGLFKKKSEKEKLMAQYKDLKKKAFDQSKVNRRESDKLEYEAQEILNKIDAIEKAENKN